MGWRVGMVTSVWVCVQGNVSGFRVSISWNGEKGVNDMCDCGGKSAFMDLIVEATSVGSSLILSLCAKYLQKSLSGDDPFLSHTPLICINILFFFRYSPIGYKQKTFWAN